MLKILKPLLIILILFFNGFYTIKGEEADSLSTQNSIAFSKQVLDTNIIQKFAKDPDFQYQKELLKKNIFSEIWSNIKMAIIRFIDKIFSSLFGVDVSKSSSNIIFWILIIIVFVCVALFLWKIKSQVLTSSGKIITESIDITHENINYIEEYQKYYQMQDYRQSIRYLLLNTLKKLDERNDIFFVSGKTLYEYQNEIKTKEVREKFSQICRVYEYVYFGNFDATKSLCDIVNTNMNSIFNSKSTE